MADENLRILVCEVAVRVGCTNHPVWPSPGPESVGNVRDVGMACLAGAFGGLQIKKSWVMLWRPIRQSPIRRISKTWQQGRRGLAKPVLDLFDRNSWGKITADKETQETC